MGVMKILMMMLLMVASVSGGGLKKKYTNYGQGDVIQVLDGGFLVWSEKLNGAVYVEDHKLWKTDDLMKGSDISIYVKRAGHFSYTTTDGAPKRVFKYLYRGEKKRSKIKEAGDKRVF